MYLYPSLKTCITMATNKHAAIRYKVLDICLSNRARKFTFEDLLHACNEALQEINPDDAGIGIRTLRDDLKHMRSAEGWNAPIETYRHGSKTCYRYADPDFSISSQPLKQEEMEQLKAAMEMLSRFEGLPQFEWVNELMPKLTQSFLLEKREKPIISFDTNQYLTGLDRLGSLFHDILYKRVLNITYQSYRNPEPIQMVVHPYHLRQYNNRWFLFGLHNDLQKISTLALDRIVDTEENTDVPYTESTLFDPNDYFEDIIGVSRMEGSQLQRIVLFFRKDAAPYVLSKPLHGSQKVVSRSEEGATVSIEVIPNFELETVILSHGERVKVLEPEDFRLKIEERLREALG